MRTSTGRNKTVPHRMPKIHCAVHRRSTNPGGRAEGRSPFRRPRGFVHPDGMSLHWPELMCDMCLLPRYWPVKDQYQRRHSMPGVTHTRWAACTVAVALATAGCGGGGDSGGDGGAVLSSSWTDPQNPLEPANTNEVQGGKV